MDVAVRGGRRNAPRGVRRRRGAAAQRSALPLRCRCLNYQESGSFTKDWLGLWNAVINILCLQESETQDIREVNEALNDLIIDSTEHPDCRQKKPVHEVHTNQKMKYTRLAEVCKRMQMPERIPDTHL